MMQFVYDRNQVRECANEQDLRKVMQTWRNLVKKVGSSNFDKSSIMKQ